MIMLRFTGGADVDARGNRATLVDLGVLLNSAQGRRVNERSFVPESSALDRVLQFQTEIFFSVESSGLAHEGLGQVLPSGSCRTSRAAR